MVYGIVLTRPSKFTIQQGYDSFCSPPVASVPPTACKVVDKEVPDFRDVSLLVLGTSGIGCCEVEVDHPTETMVSEGMYLRPSIYIYYMYIYILYIYSIFRGWVGILITIEFRDIVVLVGLFLLIHAELTLDI